MLSVSADGGEDMRIGGHLAVCMLVRTGQCSYSAKWLAGIVLLLDFLSALMFALSMCVYVLVEMRRQTHTSEKARVLSGVSQIMK